MREFRVVDLGSQARAVARHIEGWPRAKILMWLGRYGQVTHVSHPHFSRPGIEHYSFLSHCGRDSGFWFKPGKVVLQERIKNAIHFVGVSCVTEE